MPLPDWRTCTLYEGDCDMESLKSMYMTWELFGFELFSSRIVSSKYGIELFPYVHCKALRTLRPYVVALHKNKDYCMVASDLSIVQNLIQSHYIMPHIPIFDTNCFNTFQLYFHSRTNCCFRVSQDSPQSLTH